MRQIMVLLLAVALASCAVGRGIDPADQATTIGVATTSTIAVDEATRASAIATASSFYDAVLAGDGSTIASLGTDPPGNLQSELDGWAQSIGLRGGSFIVLRSSFSDASAEVTVRMALDLVEVGPWSYETSVSLVGGPDWSTIWDRSALYPTLESNDVLRVDRAWLPRAAILSDDGTALAGAEPVKVVGVVPAEIEDLDRLVMELARLGGIDPDLVRSELANPIVQPDWFVPVGSLNQALFATVGAEVAALPGVVLRDGSERLPYRDGFASHLLGRVGPITAEQLEELGFPYGPTDTIGQSSLEAVFEEQLAGRPRTAIVRVNQFGRIVEELFVLEAQQPQDLATTIDIDVQAAAEFALRDVTEPAAIVVIESSTGQVRAVASRPLTDGFNRAILGAYPPGSTFKVVTATGLLESGLTPLSQVECPTEVTLGGRTIGNAGDLELGPTTLTDAFAASCNTTFAAEAVAGLSASALMDLAQRFGFGTEPQLGVPAAGSVFPIPVDAAELAAAAIGQGRVTASPVHMASVAAAAATGVWRNPTVLSLAQRRPGIELDQGAIDALQDLTLAVVTNGTGTRAAVDGVAVRGKTGSAEFTDSANSTTHAWFIGYWDDFAIAVLVERGGGGGTFAAPLARRVIVELSG